MPGVTNVRISIVRAVRTETVPHDEAAARPEPGSLNPSVLPSSVRPFQYGLGSAPGTLVAVDHVGDPNVRPRLGFKGPAPRLEQSGIPSPKSVHSDDDKEDYDRGDQADGQQGGRPLA